MIKKNNKLALLYAGLTILCWSTVAVAFKISLRYLSAGQLLFVANHTASFILIFQVIKNKKSRQFFAQSFIQLAHSVLLGLLNPFLYYLILFKAYSILPAQVAQPINFVWPIMLVLFSTLILKQKTRLFTFIAMAVSFSGVFLLSLQGSLTAFKIEQPEGVLLALLSSVIWALYWILNLKDKRDDQVRLLTNFLFASIFITLWCLCTGEIKTISKSGILPAVYAGLFEMGITFVLWIKALQYATSTARVSNLIFLTPFISLIFIHFVLQEKIFFTSIAGLVLIIAGIFIQQYKSEMKT
jgi:drug/metabolite transporter (DMT)-like permease